MTTPVTTPVTTPLTWVVGAGGLLGSHVLGRARTTGETFVPAERLRWADPEADDQLARAVTAFADRAAGRPWQVAWCAGAGVTGTSEADLARETAMFERFLAGLATADLEPASGAVFLASSAGGLYAGARGAPFDEHTEPRPISPYGHAKLRMEQHLGEHAAATGTPTAVGRISNLYGPGQDLDKPQGLLSQAVRAHLLRRPLAVYVSLDTLRDYLFAPDCARLVLGLLDQVRGRTADRAGDTSVVKVLASQRAITIATVVGELRRLFRRSPDLVYVDSPVARYQVHDLRMQSVVLPELDAAPLTTLPSGLRSLIDDLTLRLQTARLH